ncbi:MAG: D-aminoacylase [Phycisphaerales bacterium]|nr:D-aminoacylase [Phycisphaerales bacterium]
MKRGMMLAIGMLLVGAGCSSSKDFDVVIRNATIMDGSGADGYVGDVAIRGERIVSVGPKVEGEGDVDIDATGLVVAPGFINMLSWAGESLFEDNRAMSDILQGVTLEVMGEGRSMGPLNDAMKKEMVAEQGDIKFDVKWTTLGEYLSHLEKRGVSVNVASFVGATTVRIHEIGYDDREPTADELERMKALVDQAMKEGAVGLSTSLIYAPAFYAKTDEIIALAKVAAKHGGIYTSHMRNEADNLLEAFDEFLLIAKSANIPAEVYHIKASGRANWSKLPALLSRIEAARAQGLKITADMYTYRASSTGLDAVMPPWVQEGGREAWENRLKDPAIRAKVKEEMNTPTTEWDNGYLSAGSPDNILLVGFRNDDLKKYTGKTLAEVAKLRGTSPEDTAMDLVIEDHSDVGAIFFTMSEDNVRTKIQQPYISICSDAGSYATEGIFLKRNPHPRAYGSFARFIGKYARDEGLVRVEDAVRRMSSLPAENLSLKSRGRLADGYFADVVVFDPKTFGDKATFSEPHQYATGMKHVFVNGGHVVKEGKHTGATPGKFVRGPGWTN